MYVCLFVLNTNLHRLTNLYQIWYPYHTQPGEGHRPCSVSKFHQDHKIFSKTCWLFSRTRQRPKDRNGASNNRGKRTDNTLN